ncbi:MAG: hypothetical protein RL139_887, partial [Gemmatimonadota bacterium]
GGARAYRRELQSLQGMIEQVDSASSRLNATLGRMSSPVLVQQRVRGERSVAREARQTYRVHRSGSQRVSTDLVTQQRIRAAVDKAQRAADARNARAQQRQASQSNRAWNAELRHVNRVARAEIQRERQAVRANVLQARTAFRGGARGTNGTTLGGRARGALGSIGTGLGIGAAGLGLGAGFAGATFGAAGAFLSMASSAVSLVASLSESVLQMIAFREASISTLRMMAGGNAAVAAEQYQFARQFARETPLDTQQVLELQAQVSTAGFRGQQNRDVVLAGADVGAANPNDATAASRYVRAVSQIRNAGRVRAQEINQLGEVGIGRRDLLLALGRQANVQRGTGESEAAFVARLGQMQERGRFTGEQGVAAAQDVVRQRSGGTLGAYSRSQGETLLGTLSNLRGALFDLVTGINGIENAPGVRALKAVLNGIANNLAGAGVHGKRLQAIVGRVVDDFALIGAGGLSDLSDTFTGLLGGAKDILPLVRDVAAAASGGAIGEARRQLQFIMASVSDTFGGPDAAANAGLLAASVVSLGGASIRASIALADLLGTMTIGLDRLQSGVVTPALAQNVLGGLSAPVSNMDRLRGAFGDRDAQQRVALGTLGESLGMQGVGAQAVNGIRAGIAAQRPALDADVRSLVGSIPTTSQEALAIRSPSRVMADAVGQHIPTGIALGIDRGRGPLDEAMGSLVGPGDVGGAGLGGGGGVTIGNITIQVGAGATEETGRDVARGFVDELVALLEPIAVAA